MSSNTVINPKDCSYGCNTRIYWNVFENAYFEVFAKKHICPNRVTNNKSTTNTPTAEEEEEEEQEQKSNK